MEVNQTNLYTYPSIRDKGIKNTHLRVIKIIIEFDSSCAMPTYQGKVTDFKSNHLNIITII